MVQILPSKNVFNSSETTLCRCWLSITESSRAWSLLCAGGYRKVLFFKRVSGSHNGYIIYLALGFVWMMAIRLYFWVIKYALINTNKCSKNVAKSICFSNFFLFTHSKALTSRIMTNKLISSDNFQEIIRGGGWLLKVTKFSSQTRIAYLLKSCPCYLRIYTKK